MSSLYVVGTVCRPKGIDPQPTWRIVSFSSDGYAQLTGPGPCRSLKSVMLDDLIREWEVAD
jgi:hypothetical protein